MTNCLITLSRHILLYPILKWYTSIDLYVALPCTKLPMTVANSHNKSASSSPSIHTSTILLLIQISCYWHISKV